MGSPASPQFADMVMTDLDEDCLTKLDFTPTFYFRSVDDTILCKKTSLFQILNVTIFNVLNHLLR